MLAIVARAALDGRRPALLEVDRKPVVKADGSFEPGAVNSKDKQLTTISTEPAFVIQQHEAFQRLRRKLMQPLQRRRASLLNLIMNQPQPSSPSFRCSLLLPSQSDELRGVRQGCFWNCSKI